MKMTKFIFALLLTLPVFACAESMISVEGPYVRATPPVASNSAAFMMLHNGSDQERQLVAAESDVAKHVELHNHINDNGVMRMRQVANIAIPAKGSAELKPGSYHVMLMGLHKPIQENDMVDITLVFDDGKKQRIQAVARHVVKAMHGHKHH
jgi:copper(I)-binding protein